MANHSEFRMNNQLFMENGEGKIENGEWPLKYKTATQTEGSYKSNMHIKLFISWHLYTLYNANCFRYGIYVFFHIHTPPSHSLAVDKTSLIVFLLSQTTRHYVYANTVKKTCNTDKELLRDPSLFIGAGETNETNVDI